MKIIFVLRRALSLASVLCILTSLNLSAQSFDLIKGFNEGYTIGEGLSGDGDTVYGTSRKGVTFYAFKWTAESGFEVLKRPRNFLTEGIVQDSSYDGRVLVGSTAAPSTFATVWKSDQRPQLDTNYLWSEIEAINGRGSLLAGFGYSTDSQFELLIHDYEKSFTYSFPNPSGTKSNSFHIRRGMSANGEVIAGYFNKLYTDRYQSFLIRDPMERHIVEILPDAHPEAQQTLVQTIAADGSVVGGYWRRSRSEPIKAFLYSEECKMQPIFGEVPASVTSISYNGVFFVGQKFDEARQDYRAYIANRITGELYFIEYLLGELNIYPKELRQLIVYDISWDGRSMAGVALTKNQGYQAWHLFIPDHLETFATADEVHKFCQ